MFSWICPTCGHECSASETECPTCAAKAKGALAAVHAALPPPVAAPAPAAPTAPAPAPVQATAVAPAATGEQFDPKSRPPPPRGFLYLNAATSEIQVPVQAGPAVAATAPPPVESQSGMPTWLVTILVAGVLSAIGAAAYFFLLPSSRARREAAAPAESQAAVAPAANATGQPHTLTRFIELTGFRISEDKQQKAQVRVLVVNHSAADIADLAASVQIKTSASKPQDPPVGTFELKVPRLGPFESKEVTAPVKANVRAYELPDWQFLRADFQITSP